MVIYILCKTLPADNAFCFMLHASAHVVVTVSYKNHDNCAWNELGTVTVSYYMHMLQ